MKPVIYDEAGLNAVGMMRTLIALAAIIFSFTILKAFLEMVLMKLYEVFVQQKLP